MTICARVGNSGHVDPFRHCDGFIPSGIVHFGERSVNQLVILVDHRARLVQEVIEPTTECDEAGFIDMASAASKPTAADGPGLFGHGVGRVRQTQPRSTQLDVVRPTAVGRGCR
jgi:hypothetical protein